MSNLLNESIVDAKALRNSALKNAESAVIEKYADEVKKTLENLLEQEEPEIDLSAPAVEEAEETNGEEVVEEQSDEIPLASTDGLAENEGENLNAIQAEGEEVEVTLDLGALQEAIEALSNELDEEIELDTEALTEEEDEEDEAMEEEIDLNIEDDAAKAEADAEQMSNLDDLNEDEMNAFVTAVTEKLTADMGFELSGWAGRATSQLKDEQERELAKEASTESEEELALEEEQEELNESNENLKETIIENESLKEELANYQSAMENLKENLYEVNLSNARLLYTNRVLRNTSLNERQKDKIVEAISGAGSVTEAKTIFETLQSTVEATPKRNPQSLSEAISGRNSVLTASRKETNVTSQDPFSDRMRRLAGIK
jgi:hypothetical protein